MSFPPFYMRSPLGNRIRSPLSGFNGVRAALAVEAWNLSTQTSAITSLGNDWTTPTIYAAGSPSSAVSACAALIPYNTADWSSLATYFWNLVDPSQYYNPPNFHGFPMPATNPAGSLGGLSNGCGTPNMLIHYPPPYTGDTSGEAPYALADERPNLYPGAWPWVGGEPSFLMSDFLFNPGAFVNPSAPPTYQWNNYQMAGRTRYRVKTATGNLRGIRLNCELRGMTNDMGAWTSGITPVVWADNALMGEYGPNIILTNFSFNSYVFIPNHVAAASDTTSDWVEVPLPEVPSDWDGQAQAESSGCLLGLGIVDFFGLTCSQWQSITGLSISGIP